MTPEERRAYLLAPIQIRVIGRTTGWAGHGAKEGGQGFAYLHGFRIALENGRPERGYRVLHYRGNE